MAAPDNLLASECIYLKTEDFYCKYMYSEIYQIAVSGRACNVYLSPDKSIKLALSITLSELMKFLPTQIFIQVHRSYVVNINHIERIIGNTLFVGEAMVPIGREYREKLYSRLNIAGLSTDKQ